jgi:hypothetical protein
MPYVNWLLSVVLLYLLDLLDDLLFLLLLL